MFHPAQSHRLIPCINPVYFTASTGSYISMKNVAKAWVVVNLRNLSGQAVTIAPYQAIAVAGTAAKAISTGGIYWYSNDMNADETLTQQSTTPGTSIVFGATTGYKMGIMEINGGMFDSAGSTAFDCLTVQVSGGTTDDTICVNYLLEMRYGEADTPATITD